MSRRGKLHVCGVVQQNAVVLLQVLRREHVVGIGEINLERFRTLAHLLDSEVTDRDRGVNESFTAIEDEDSPSLFRSRSGFARNRLFNLLALLGGDRLKPGGLLGNPGVGFLRECCRDGEAETREHGGEASKQPGDAESCLHIFWINQQEGRKAGESWPCRECRPTGIDGSCTRRQVRRNSANQPQSPRPKVYLEG